MQDGGGERHGSADLTKDLDWSPGSNRAAQVGGYDFAGFQNFDYSPETPLQEPAFFGADAEGTEKLALLKRAWIFDRRQD